MYDIIAKLNTKSASCLNKHYSKFSFEDSVLGTCHMIISKVIPRGYPGYCVGFSCPNGIYDDVVSCTECASSSSFYYEDEGRLKYGVAVAAIMSNNVVAEALKIAREKIGVEWNGRSQYQINKEEQ